MGRFLTKKTVYPTMQYTEALLIKIGVVIFAILSNPNHFNASNHLDPAWPDLPIDVHFV